MTSTENFINALNCNIRFTTPEGDYEGNLKQVFATSRVITVAKALFLPSNIKLGTLNFMFSEVSNVKILHRAIIPSENENKNKSSLIYFRPEIEGVFNLDGDSEAESDCNVKKVLEEEKFVLKLLPCFSKCISTDSKIIDYLDQEFTLAIRVILSEDLIGVSLEGPKISRHGILTWLCISTLTCTYLFDILALGEKSFQNGLKSILENSKIKKIFHDCRLASDCLFHMYNVRLVNVFDTQVADSFVMMQESKNCTILKQVSSLDACLSYYLQIPDDYLYSPLVFSLDMKSDHYHGLRPLKHSFRGAMIKNVIFLRLLKRELETALSTPLRRATEVYLNVFQNATDSELLVAPPVLDELPPELLLEGIKVVRYQQHEYIPPIVSSGPPYRKLVNPIKDFVECCKKFRTNEKSEQKACEDFSKNAKATETFKNISDKTCKSNSQSFRDVSKVECFSHLKIRDNTPNVNKFEKIKNCDSFLPSIDKSYVCNKEIKTKMPQNAFLKMASFNEEYCDFEHASIKAEKSYPKKITDLPPAVYNYECKKIVGNTFDKVPQTSNIKLKGKSTFEDEKKSFLCVNSFYSENECKFSNPTDNCLLDSFSVMPYDKDLGSAKSSVNNSVILRGNSTMPFGQETKPKVEADYEALWAKLRKECKTQQSDCDQNFGRPKLRFIPAGMESF